MNRLLRFEVRLRNRRSVFRGGQRLNGSVLVESRNSVRAVAFFVECVGFSEVRSASVSQVKEATQQQQQQQQDRQVRQQHLDLRENLLQENRQLESRSFSFKLPSCLPHSVEFNGVGFVRYCCRATAVFSSAVGDSIHASAFFTVIEEVDLNSPAVQQQCSFDEASAVASEEKLHRLLKGNLRAELVLQRAAFVPGEDVHCTINLHNACSSVPVQRLELRLLQRGRTSSSCTHGRELPVAEESLTPVTDPEQFSCTMRHKIHIPGVVPSSLTNHRLQHPLLISYCVQLVVTFGLDHETVKELILECPIVIGTVPKRELLQMGEEQVSIEPAFVEVSRQQLLHEGGSRPAASGSYSDRRHLQLYILYCAYYPTISLLAKRSVRSILKNKRLSVQESSTNSRKLSQSTSFNKLHETPV